MSGLERASKRAKVLDLDIPQQLPVATSYGIKLVQCQHSTELQQQSHSTYDFVKFSIQQQDYEAARNKANQYLNMASAGDKDTNSNTQVVCRGLWVQRYSPNSYCDLVSGESLNLRVIQWLKQWDGCVFGGDSSKCGSKPILLLGGSPGVGKSTLATTIAKQCGYFPFEINASIDRSTTRLKELVRQACQNVSCIAADRKPSCIILDEIDGLELPSITAVINLFTGKAPLRRPLICICNDLYSRKLLAIRQYAEVVELNGNMQQCTLITRVKNICKQEGVDIHPAKLAKVVNDCQGDIRRTINLIQLLSQDPSLDLNFDSYSTDKSSSVLRLQEQIVHKSGFQMEELFNNVLDTGNIDLQLMGQFHNYPRLQFLDPLHTVSVKLLNYLILSDIFQRATFSNMNFSLKVYCGLSAIAFNQCACLRSNPTIVWPHHDLQCVKEQKNNKAILCDWLATLESGSLEALVATLEVIPNLLNFVQGLLSAEKPSITYIAQVLRRYKLKIKVIESSVVIDFTQTLHPSLHVLAQTQPLLCSASLLQKICMEIERQSLSFKETKESKKDDYRRKQEIQKSDALFQGICRFTKNLNSGVAKKCPKIIEKAKYIHNSGLTNAVKRSMKIKDLK